MSVNMMAESYILTPLENITDSDIVNNYIDNNHDLSRIKSKEI